MSVDIYCPYENKRHRKRRRGIAQLSLSSLHSADTFHVNHKNSENKLSSPTVETMDNHGDNCAVREDESTPSDLATSTLVTTTAVSHHKSIIPSNSVQIRRRRRRRRKETVEKEAGFKEQSQQNEREKVECKTDNNRADSKSPTMDENSNDLSPVNMKTAALASIEDHAGGGNSGESMLKMNEICSIEYFRATPLEEFRKRCRDCVKRSIQLSKKVSSLPQISSLPGESSDNDNSRPFGLTRYDRMDIIRHFTNDINWTSLCDYHDKHEYRRLNHGTNETSKTALCEIVMALMDPMATPTCCHCKCLLYVLLNALLVSPSISISSQKRRKLQNKKYSSTSRAANSMSRWTPSQEFLLESVRKLLLSEKMPLESHMSNYVQDFVTYRPPSLSAAKRRAGGMITMSPNKVNRLLSATYWLLSSSMLRRLLPIILETDLVSSGLFLLQRIDDWSIQIDTESQQQCVYDKSSTCLFCNKNSAHVPKKNRSHRSVNRNVMVEAMSNLHDDAIYVETESMQKLYSTNKVRWRRSYDDHQKKVSLKEVLTMKQNKAVGSTVICTCNRKNNGRTEKQKDSSTIDSFALSSDWFTVCSRAYKKFMSYSAERRQQQQGRKLSNRVTAPKTMEKQTSNEDFLGELVNNSVLHYASPSRRACIALVAHSFGGPNNPFYFKYVARLFWQGYLVSSRQQNGFSSTWLRFYSEWLSDCAVFDQREVAWEAFQPILRHITTYLQSSEQGELDLNDASYDLTAHVGDRRESSNHLDASLMACLAYILHRRSYLFLIHRVNKDDAPKSFIEKDFRSFINLLSIHCGECSELWLDLFSDATRDLVESTLQRLGILSFSIAYRGGDLNIRDASTGIGSLHNSNSNASMKTISASNWPFRDEFSLRKAMGRIDRVVLCLENGRFVEKVLLSHHSTETLGDNEETKTAKVTDKVMPSVPMTTYLHDSGILSLIFSYCGAKRLAKIPLVCKTWKAVSDTVSNSLWEKAYLSSFGKYRWSSIEAEERYRLSRCTIAPTESSSFGTESISSTYWKNLFIQKQIAEKMVRFQRNSRTGYKYRTCSYIGCLHVLKTVEQERKHDKMHLRQLAKEKAVLKKKRTTQKTKETSRSKSRMRKNKVDGTEPKLKKNTG